MNPEPHIKLPEEPRPKKLVGGILLIVGILSIITPFTPLGFLALVGLQMLGIKIIPIEKVKKWFKRGNSV